MGSDDSGHEGRKADEVSSSPGEKTQQPEAATPDEQPDEGVDSSDDDRQAADPATDAGSRDEVEPAAGARPTDPEAAAGEELTAAQLEQQARPLLPRGSSLRVIEVGEQPPSYTAVLRVEERSAEERAALARRLVTRFARSGAAVEPVFVDSAQWTLLDAGSSRLLGDRQRSLKLRARYRQGRRYPAAFRRLIVDTAREWRYFVEQIRRDASLPLHMTAALVAEVLREIASLLAATRDLHFDASPESLARLSREFSDELGEDPAALYMQVRGVVRQARLQYESGNPARLHELDWPELIERVQRLLGRIQRYARRQFTTAAEESRYRRLRLIFAGGGGLAACLLVVTWLITTRPIEPAAAKVSGKPGGITGTYFLGKNFKKQVLERTDPAVNLLLGPGSPGKGIPIDNFSVRWEGYFKGRAGSYELCADVDNGARVFINDELLIDAWEEKPPRTECATLRVRDGWYKLKVEYFEATGAAKMQLKIGESERRLRLVPSSVLCCR